MQSHNCTLSWLLKICDINKAENINSTEIFKRLKCPTTGHHIHDETLFKHPPHHIKHMIQKERYPTSVGVI